MSALRFCKNCNNLMSPRESKAKRQLIFVCKSCGSEEDSRSTKGNQNVIYRNNLKASVVTKLESVDPAVIFDPTLPRTNKIKCLKCGESEAVFFQADSGKESSMNLVFVCTNLNCKHKWVN